MAIFGALTTNFGEKEYKFVEPTPLTVSELVACYRSGQSSPSEVLEDQFRLIDEFNPYLNAFRKEADRVELRKQAAESSARYRRGAALGVWDGVPITVKDTSSNAVKGWRSMGGSRVIADNDEIKEDAESCTAADYLLGEGALLLGRTTSPELGWKGSASSPLTGITRNPHNLVLSPGGSTAGGAALTAVGVGFLATGSDGGGSIRIPASCCGIVGLKPTFGIGSRLEWPHIAHVGPLARSVSDIALYMEGVVKRYHVTWDLSQATLPHQANMDFTMDYLSKGVKGLRIAYAPTLGGCGTVDPQTLKLANQAAEVFKALGAEVIHCEPAVSEKDLGFSPHQVWANLWCAGLAHTLPKLGYNDSNRDKVDPGVLMCQERGDKMTATELVETIAQRDIIGDRMAAFMRDGCFDLILSPTLPQPVPKIGPVENDPSGYYNGNIDWVTSKTATTSITLLYNLSKQPGVSINCGFMPKTRAPVGIMLGAAMHQDHVALRAAFAYEQYRPGVAPSKL